MKDYSKDINLNKSKHISSQMREALLRGIKILDAFMITIPFAICWMYYYAIHISSPYYEKGNWLIIAIFFILFVIFGRVYEGFLISYNKISEMVFSQSLAILISDTIMYILTILINKGLITCIPLLVTVVIQIVLASIWSLSAQTWYFHTFSPKRTAIVYDVRQGVERLFDDYGIGKKFNVIYTYSVKEILDSHMPQLDEIEVVFLCGVHSHDRNIILKQCVIKGVTAYIIPRIGDVLIIGSKRAHMLNLPMLRQSGYSSGPEFLLFKRLFDVIFSVVGLIVLSPVMLIAAIAIKITDQGAVIYKQCRLTRKGRTFNLLKFRSMRVDAEKDGIARLSTGEYDERVTPVGKVIRKYRIDEIPQLINILKGDMSFVGPRPERPEIAEEYEKELPEFRLRLLAKAGLTGYAQVYGKYNSTPYDKLQMDLMYIAKPSILEDLAIMIATLKILFVSNSTEGIQEGSINAMEKEEVWKNH